MNNKESQLRTNQIEGMRINQTIEQISNVQYTFIVDNTPYPYPTGAYSFSAIPIDVTLQVAISISSNY